MSATGRCLFLGKPHLREDLINPLVPECPVHAVHLPAQVQVLLRGQVAIDRAVLRNDAHLHLCLERVAVDIDAIDADRSHPV